MLSGSSISISFVCPLSHPKTDWPKGCLTGGSAGLPVGTGDGRGWTGCSVFPSCAFRFCSCPLGVTPTPPNPTTHPPVQSLRDGSVPATRSAVREVVAKEGSHQQETQCLTLDVEEDREEWWANDVLTNCVAEEVHHSRYGGPRHEQREREKERETLEWEVFGLGEIWVFWPVLCPHFLRFKPLFEVHIYKTTWSRQTFGQNRKHLSPPRMKSNPFSPGQTCDLEPGIRYT